jgi:hypothetical protein
VDVNTLKADQTTLREQCDLSMEEVRLAKEEVRRLNAKTAADQGEYNRLKKAAKEQEIRLCQAMALSEAYSAEAGRLTAENKKLLELKQQSQEIHAQVQARLAEEASVRGQAIKEALRTSESTRLELERKVDSLQILCRNQQSSFNYELEKNRIDIRKRIDEERERTDSLKTLYSERQALLERELAAAKARMAEELVRSQQREEALKMSESSRLELEQKLKTPQAPPHPRPSAQVIEDLRQWAARLRTELDRAASGNTVNEETLHALRGLSKQVGMFVEISEARRDEDP